MRLRVKRLLLTIAIDINKANAGGENIIRLISPCLADSDFITNGGIPLPDFLTVDFQNHALADSVVKFHFIHADRNKLVLRVI